MPRYLVETVPREGPLGDLDVQLIARRFPEISIEHRFETNDERGRREFFMCTSPTEAHIRRWAAAVYLQVCGVAVATTRTDPPVPSTTGRSLPRDEFLNKET